MPKNVRFSHRKVGGEISAKFFEKVALNEFDGEILGASTNIFEKCRENFFVENLRENFFSEKSEIQSSEEWR